MIRWNFRLLITFVRVLNTRDTVCVFSTALSTSLAGDLRDQRRLAVIANGLTDWITCWGTEVLASIALARPPRGDPAIALPALDTDGLGYYSHSPDRGLRNSVKRSGERTK